MYTKYHLILQKYNFKNNKEYLIYVGDVGGGTVAGNGVLVMGRVGENQQM